LDLFRIQFATVVGHTMPIQLRSNGVAVYPERRRELLDRRSLSMGAYEGIQLFCAKPAL
jgi:hypothetical protein